MGRWTTRGNFIPEKWRMRTFMVPSLEGFALTPFVSPKVEQQRNTLELVQFFPSDEPLMDECRKRLQ
jgi:hypothetical protein